MGISRQRSITLAQESSPRQRSHAVLYMYIGLRLQGRAVQATDLGYSSYIHTRMYPFCQRVCRWLVVSASEYGCRWLPLAFVHSLPHIYIACGNQTKRAAGTYRSVPSTAGGRPGDRRKRACICIRTPKACQVFAPIHSWRRLRDIRAGVPLVTPAQSTSSPRLSGGCRHQRKNKNKK
jgi:hypothetical protein